jgi:hypothetical protein
MRYIFIASIITICLVSVIGSQPAQALDLSSLQFHFTNGLIDCSGISAYGCSVTSTDQVYLDVDMPPAEVQGVILHEIGHFVVEGADISEWNGDQCSAANAFGIWFMTKTLDPWAIRTFYPNGIKDDAFFTRLLSSK